MNAVFSPIKYSIFIPLKKAKINAFKVGIGIFLEVLIYFPCVSVKKNFICRICRFWHFRQMALPKVPNLTKPTSAPYIHSKPEITEEWQL